MTAFDALSLSSLATLLGKISGILALAWMLHFVLQKANPRWRVVLWRMTAVALVIIPLLGLIIPKIPLPVLRSTTPEPVREEYVAFVSTVERNPSLEYASPIESPPARQTQIPVSQTMETHPDRPVLWGGIYLAITMLLLALALRQRIRLRSIILRSAPVPEAIQSLAEAISRRLGCRKRYAIRCSRAVSTPLLAGLWRKTILLPRPVVEKCLPDELEGILLHELSHLQSRDLFWFHLLKIQTALLWFHPLMWAAGRAHATACEQVCDAVVSNLTTDREVYIRTLARMALEVLKQREIPAALPMIRRSEILQRLDRIRSRLSALPLGWKALAPTLLFNACLVVALGGVTLTYADQEKGAPVAVEVADSPSVAGARTLYFPSQRSLGTLQIQDEGTELLPYYLFENQFHSVGIWDALGEARGKVVVPPGKRVCLNLSNQALDDLSPLKSLKPNDLDVVVISGYSATVSDAHLSFLKNLEGLGELRIWGAERVTGSGLESLKNCRGLKRLFLTSKSFGDEGAARLAQFPALEVLWLGASKLSDEGIKHVADLPALRELYLHCPDPSVKGYGLDALSNLESLQYLNLSGNITDEVLAVWKAPPNLKSLKLVSKSIADKSLVTLARIKTLEQLDLYNTQVTDQGLRHLRSLPALKMIELGKRGADWKNAQITAAGMAYLKEIRTLEDIRLPNTGIKDEGLEYLSELPNLKRLRVGLVHFLDSKDYQSHYTDRGVRALGKVTTLESLELGGPISDAGLEAIGKLTRLKNLNLFGCCFTPVGLAQLKNLRSLEELFLWSDRITKSDLNQLTTLSNLRTLRAERFTEDDGVLDLSGLRNLEQLNLTPGKGCSITDADLKGLSKMDSLRWFQIGAYPVSDRAVTGRGLAYLSNLTKMERLCVGSSSLSDDDLVHLRNMKALNHLSLYGRITDRGLRHLEAFPALSYLNIQSSETFGADAYDRLKRRLPDLTNIRLNEDQDLGPRIAAAPGPGLKVPDFEVSTVDGKTLHLEDFKGKVVLLYFWATWCNPCIKSMPDLKAFYAELHALGDFEMLALSLDSDGHLFKRFLAENRLPWQNARIGQYSKIASEFGVDGVPDYFLIGPDGAVLLSGERDWEKIHAKVKEALGKI